MPCSICGSEELQVTDFVTACQDCGYQLEGPQLVARSSDAVQPPQKRSRAGEQCQGLDLSQCKQRARTKHLSTYLSDLGAEASGMARTLSLPDSVALAARQAVHSHMTACASAAARAPRGAALAVLLVVAARLVGHPLTLRHACEQLHASVHPAQRLLTLALKRLPEPLPAATVRALLIDFMPYSCLPLFGRDGQRT